MANSQVLLADLKAGRCSNVAEVQLLRFWEARNVRKGGELTSVYMFFVDENFIFSFRLNQNWFANPIVLKVMSLIQQVGLKTHSCCMCDRALSPVSLSTPTKSSSRLLHLHI
uniref:Uncharacterized protein n=1 Tax=Brassica campestris TaxID=3711 RepID=M4FB31_BRACM|nr:unnamed protein product [Brassica rapa]